MYFGVISHLLDDEIAVHGLGYACDGLPTLPVGEKAIIGVVQPRDVDGLLPLPIEEKAKSWSRTNMSCSLSACACGARNTLSFLPVEEKSLAVRLRWPFPPACREKRAPDGLVE